VALRKLGQLDAPIVVANVRGYYDPLLAQLDRSVAEGFSPRDVGRLFRVAADAAGIAAVLTHVADA
jgi:predicted Rossmann-fold nucleotide-binding protein